MARALRGAARVTRLALWIALAAAVVLAGVLASRPWRGGATDAAGDGMFVAYLAVTAAATLSCLVVTAAVLLFHCPTWLAVLGALGAAVCAFLLLLLALPAAAGTLSRQVTDQSMPTHAHATATVVTILSPDAPMPPGADLAMAGWRVLQALAQDRLRAMQHDLQLVSAAVATLAADAALASRFGASTVEQWTHALSSRDAALDRAVVALAHHDLAQAGAALRVVVHALEPANPRDDLHFSLDTLLYCLPTNATQAGERFRASAQALAHTLDATWTWERVCRLGVHPSQESPAAPRPPSLPTLTPLPKAPTVRTGSRVPTTGLWQPQRDGCPNLLIAGEFAPAQIYACRRLDYPALAGADGAQAQAAWSHFEFETRATRWRLVREVDARTE